MDLSAVDITPYEGLVRKTASIYAPYLDEEAEDVEQLLRLKVAQALRAYDPLKDRLGEKSWVFSAVKNRAKDMVRQQGRRVDALREAAGQEEGACRVLSIQELTPDELKARKFEADNFAVREDDVYGIIEEQGVFLPSTLTELERKLVALLMLEFNQKECAALLGITRFHAARLHQNVQSKMLDWKPSTVAPAVVQDLEALLAA